MNQRVMVSNGAFSTMYSFNPFGQRSGTIDASLALQREQVYWGGKPMAMVVQSGTPVIRYQFQTYNGSERLQDSLGGGGLTSDYSWNPWGDSQHVDAGTDEDPYHYAMLDGDADGTQHAQFRNYNPKTAQWLSPDPYMGSYVPQDPQSLNRYAYAGNNPLRFIDPSGLLVMIGECIYAELYSGGGDILDSSGNVVGTTERTFQGLELVGCLGGGGGGGIGSVAVDNGGGGGYIQPNPLAPYNPCPSSGTAPPPTYYANKSQYAPYNFLSFRRGGALDAQVGKGSNGKPYNGSTAYANYVYGVYMAAAGYTLDQALALADTYAQYRSSYPSSPRMGGPDYPFTPRANVINIANGYFAQQNGTTCHK